MGFHRQHKLLFMYNIPAVQVSLLPQRLSHWTSLLQPVPLSLPCRSAIFQHHGTCREAGTMTTNPDWTGEVLKKQCTQQPPDFKYWGGWGKRSTGEKGVKEHERCSYMFIQQRFTRQLLSQTLDWQ